MRQLNAFLKLHYKLHLHYSGLHWTAGDSQQCTGYNVAHQPA